MATAILEKSFVRPVSVKVAVWPVIHATERPENRFLPLAEVSRTPCFSLAEAHEEARYQSTLWPATNRFAVYGSEDEYLGYYREGEFKGPYVFAVEEE